MGSGVVSMDHDVPFHFSARMTVTPELLRYSPTAVQALAEVQDTPPRALPCAPEGLGVAWTDHEVPFHASARVTSIPELPV